MLLDLFVQKGLNVDDAVTGLLGLNDPIQKTITCNFYWP